MIPITITYNEGHFQVVQGDEQSGDLFFEEMLGMVAALTIPGQSERLLNWIDEVNSPTYTETTDFNPINHEQTK